MKKYLFILSSFLFLVSIYTQAETSTKLTGTVIGSINYYDYSTSECSTSATLANYAFDGLLTNSFATCDVTGGWTGLDFGEPCVITKISYCPRTGQAARMLLGVFEGANNPDFGDAVPLFMVTTTPAQSVLTAQSISSTKGFRYVRYCGPENAKCNVAEIEFYGYKSVGTTAYFPQTTNLPTVIIHTTNAQDIVDKETYIKGIVSVISDNGTKIISDSLEIKGRGNASWDFPKKPYRMKLYKKASLLGMPATEKNWTLINNYGDKTLMRNFLAFDLSKHLEMPYTPAGKAVDVFLNGQYKGTYQLCDQVEVATGRIVVDKMKTTDIALPELAGGYFIEMDAYASEETSWFTSTRNQIPVTIKYPKDDEIVAQQSAFIKFWLGTMENALYASNYTDKTNGFRRYIDTETFAKHFLVGEISGNTDTYWSTYMYKTRTDDKFYFGPVWDFDIAYENDYRTYPINDNSEWVYVSKGSSANGVRDLVNRIYSDTAFVVQLKSIYARYRSVGKISADSMLKVADYYAAQLDQSQKLNFTRWNILNTKVHMNPQVYGSYAGEVNNVKNYIKNRIVWMDKKLGYVASGYTLPEAMSDVYSWIGDNQLHIEGISDNTTAMILDITGRIVFNGLVYAGEGILLKKGVYAVNVKNKLYGTKMLKCIIP